MKNAEEFAENFMKKLSDGRLSMQREPEGGKPFEPTEKFVEQKTKEFGEMLSSPLASEIFNNIEREFSAIYSRDESSLSSPH